MSNALYGKGREHFARGDIVWKAAGGDTIKAVLIDTGVYTVNIDGHEFYTDLSGIVGSAVTLTIADPTLGVCDANDITFSAVTGDSVEALVIYKDSGTPSTSPLLAYIDNATGLPVTPNGGDIAVNWDNGANKIFKL